MAKAAGGRSAKPGTKTEFDAERFAASNFDFSTAGVRRDSALGYGELSATRAWCPILFERLNPLVRPDGRLLAFFHGKADAPGSTFSRYQLTDESHLVVLSSGNFPAQAIYQTRQIEKFLQSYSSVRFFLGKDNVREVTAIR